MVGDHEVTATGEEELSIHIIYATRDVQSSIELRVPQGTTLGQALVSADIVRHYPELKGQELTVGIYGEIIHDPDNYPLEEGDRIEIYRPLLIDPKEARRLRARQ